jgi:hypothetical protein
MKKIKQRLDQMTLNPQKLFDIITYSRGKRNKTKRPGLGI